MLDTPRKNPPESPAATSSSRGQRLWGVLLVLDSFLVIIFGGALAAKIYQFWQVPPPEVHRRAPRLHEPPKPEAAKPPAPEAGKAAEAPKPEPPKAPAAAKPPEPAPAPPAAKAAGPAPKPSVVQEPAKPHQAPAPMGGASKAAAPAPGDSKPLRPKAVAAEFKLKAPRARKVELAGAFLRGGRKTMVLDNGVWTLTVYLTPNVYRYHFIVDGRKRLDPENPKTERGASAMTVP